MSDTAAQTQDGAEGSTESGEKDGKRRRKVRRRFVAGAVVVLVAVTGAGLAIANPFSEDDTAAESTTADTALATVTQGPLSAQITESGTLTYAARSDGTPYSVINQVDGIFTSLPGEGEVIECGQALYTVAETPVPLVCGATPFYRDLAVGAEGADVQQLNAMLLELGYADEGEIAADSDAFDSETAEALTAFQAEIGAQETGGLRLGEAVALPGPLRVTGVLAETGTPGQRGGPVLETTTTNRQIVVELNPALQTGVEVGDQVTVTLPDQTSTTGEVSSIGAVTSPEEGGDAATGGEGEASLPVYITLDDPETAGDLDEAPVQVQITTEEVDNALSVPVTALIGLAGGQYAVERVDDQGVHHTVPVDLGLFDSAGGMVEVSGDLAPGDQVAVPAS
ncbi:peptidoglycan-binding protein [Streptomyces sp. B6B3]|uniref:peptidoglycan-binding protein n=1 Tax=Streptomyces sp. B6B3 TaxID=3153570 RepID=UPI00325FD4E1